MNILENQIRRQYQLFGHNGYWTQLHAQEPLQNRLVSRELVKGPEEVVKWAKAFNGKANLYIGRAARNESGLPIRTSVFTLDVDPRRDKGTASSEDQHRQAIRAGRGVLKVLGDGYLCSSGNGALVIVPFGDSVEEGLERFSAQCKQFESQLRDAFQTGEINVDATQDTARLARLVGSINVKGERRQWRYARFLSQPVFRTKRSSLRESIAALPVREHGYTENNSGGAHPLETTSTKVPALPTYDHNVYQTREKAEFAFALRLKLAGMGPDDIRQQLALYGYIQNPRDAQRVIEKLFATGPGAFGGGASAVQRSTPGVASSPVVSEPLWTPAAGTGFKNVQHETGSSIGTGFKFLDSKLGGFRPGYVYAIEAPTNVGKSTYITQVANHLARCGRRVLLVITEMDVREAVTRIKAVDTGVSGHALEAGALTSSQRSVVEAFDGRFSKYPLSIRYTTSPRQGEIEKDIQESKAEVVLWDYFQHFETGVEHRQTQLASLARWFESTALKYQIPFVVAAQLHNNRTGKDGKYLPSTMDFIKDCKVLNDVAKAVITLNWDQRGQQTEDGPVPVAVEVEKNKGRMGKGVLRLVRNVPKFEEL